MDLSRRRMLVYGLLAGFWLLILGWQIEEHWRVQKGARTNLSERSRAIANTVSACLRGMQFRGTVFQERLEPLLKELVYGNTHDWYGGGDLKSIALLNAAGEAVASAGDPVDFGHGEILQKGERWGDDSVVFINPVDLGAALASAGITNPTVVLPPFQPPTNRSTTLQGVPRSPDDSGSNTSDAPVRDGRTRDGDSRFRRPPWFRGMGEREFQELLAKRSLHGLALALSTRQVDEVVRRDLWLRAIIISLSTVAVMGVALAWRNLSQTSELQIRLVRASELNTHLREMNLAAAGLAHETRNPLNIIRGLAQMISRAPETGPEVRQKSAEIVNEADKVASQLNEFINYSRPRQVRPAVLTLAQVVSEVARTLAYDLEEKEVRLEITSSSLRIQADEQMFRQSLFNLLLNAIQAVGQGGCVQVKSGVREGGAWIEVCDDGPGVPPERRKEIFKPYFTTQQRGTGLGLAVVQQIVLAHGWEVACLPNESKGAVFRISHIQTGE